MKKLLILSLLLIFFAGCNKQAVQNIIPIQKNNQQFEASLPLDNHTYQEPKITIWVWTGSIISPKNEIAKGEYDYAVDPELVDWKISKVRGYVYTYLYKDLWLEITTSPLYEPYFYELSTWLILKRNGNVIYLSWTLNNTPDYIEVFYKDIKAPFEDEIINKHLPKWATIETGILEQNNWLFSSMQWFHVVYIQSPDEKWMSFDKQFPQNRLHILFVMDPKVPNKYYKFSVSDCAPGPCSIFGKIRFL